jgi:hypothetical protein
MKKIPHIEVSRHEKLREDVEYVQTKTREIEDRIIAATEDLFETPKERELLHISIRVSCDFHKFLLDSGDSPLRDEAEYVGDTIRSGIDWFFLLAFHCHGIRDDLAKWTFGRQATSNFRELRKACLKHFEILSSASASAGELLGSLLAFIHLELIFMAQTFPAIVDSNLTEDQWQTYRT